MRLRLLIIPFLLCLSLFPTATSAFEREWPSVTVNGHPGVVLPRDAAADAVTWVVWPDDEIDGYWLPGQPWLEKAEDAVSTLAGPENATPAEATTAPSEPKIYGYRQYAGFIENGERKILINSFCKEFDNWRSQYILVMDGGSCFWNAVYNVDTGKVEHLYVNGVA